jgi:iron complex outermembrane receptor protein
MRGVLGQIEIGPSQVDGKAASEIRSSPVRIGTMTSQRRCAIHLGGASWLLFCAMGYGAMAQDAAPPPPSATQLPEITVTAPRPIQRRNVIPSRTPGRIARAVPARTREPQPAPVAPQQGVLPVVTDRFATVTVVPNEEIRRAGGATLGDLLFAKPGITGSSFAPGASSRPIIRGLDNNRVGIVENGVGGGGASDLGEDHFVPIDPLATSQIEVVRGPAALRYGST